jgi:putative chitinase
MITPDQWRSLYPKARAGHLEAIAETGEDLLAQFGISETPIRLSYFLAQIGHESGGLSIAEESLYYRAERMCAVWPRRFPTVAAAEPFAHNPEALANNVYANRMGNGPPESGDGWAYRGRGYIQITGRDGYERVGAVAWLDLVNEPDLAASPEHALHVACAFWRWKDLNPLCEPGGFVAVTKRINGGTNGMADRREWLQKVERILGDDAASGAAPEPDVETVVAVQRALQEFGYPEVGAADGLIGSRTNAAIHRFRQQNGLPPGGIDAVLLEALGLDL